MKHISILAAAAALAFSHTAFAKDITEGTIAFSGGTTGALAILNSEVDAYDTEYDTVTLNLQTEAIYFVQQNIGLGLGYTYESSTSEFEGDYEVSSTSVTFEPGLYLNHDLDEDNSILFNVAFIFGSSTDTETDQDDIESSIRGFKFGGTFQHFVTDSVTANISAEYGKVSYEDEDSDFSVDTSGLAFGIGATIYLGN